MCVLCVREGGKRKRWVLEVNLGFMDVSFDDGSREGRLLVLRSLELLVFEGLMRRWW